MSSFSQIFKAVATIISDAIRKKYLFFFLEKNMFFRIKNLASKKNTQKVFFFFFLLFSKYSFKRNYKLTVA